MDRDAAYKILYNQVDGHCNHSPEILSMFLDIIYEKHSGKVDIETIDRWNIYMPSTIHLVYVLNITRKDKSVYRESYQLTFPIAEFATRYRNYQLDKLEIGI